MITRLSLTGLATALLVSAVGVQAQQSSAHAAVQHAVDAWSKVRTVRATFEQTVSNALTGTSAHAQGEYEQRRPNKLAVRFRDPDGDRIVADGTWLWLYLPSSTPGQVIKRPVAEGGATVDLTGAFLDDPFTKYDLADGGAATVDGRPVRVVVLTPKPDGPREFSKATVWIDDADGYVRQFEVVEPNGVTRRVHLTSLRVNVPVDDAAFNFAVPKGARVVAR
ncbi:MAG: outer membrane lipoprotein chaperone LolA [Gemmatimonadaceae bacterium]